MTILDTIDTIDTPPHKAARVSACGRYRYELERHTGNERGVPITWLMLNPSTADASKDDPTIRKVVGFSRRNGFGLVKVINLFAWRATKPKDVVLNLADAEGDGNFYAVRTAAGIGRPVVCAWGNEHGRTWVYDQAETVLGWLADIKPTLLCLGINRDTSPRHPLMVPYAQPLVPFERIRR